MTDKSGGGDQDCEGRREEEGEEEEGEEERGIRKHEVIEKTDAVKVVNSAMDENQEHFSLIRN
jgi:hypothetical protein